MTTFNITTDTNIDACAGGTGGHVYNIRAGATLTIDQDSCAGLNGTAQNSIASIVASSTSGGSVVIEAEKCRLIPFTNGSGTLTAGATIDCGSASGIAIAIYTSLTATPALTGASGWIKIKQWNSAAYPTSGTYTKGGFTFDVNGADIVGWIEVRAELGSYTGAFIGSFVIAGEWFELGETDGSAGQTFQLPTNGLAVYHVAGVYIETTAGEEDWEFYACTGYSSPATDVATDAYRGKVCWISTAGVVTLGNNGSGTAGYVPGSGRRVVIGNVFGSMTLAADRTANVLPTSTLGNRFAVGVIGTQLWTMSLSKAALAWYVYPYACVDPSFTLVALCDAISATYCTGISMVGVGVGATQNVTTITPIFLSYCNDTSIVNVRAWKAGTTASGAVLSVSQCLNVDAQDSLFAYMRNVGSNAPYCVSVTSSSGVTIDNCTNIVGSVYSNGTSDLRIFDLNYASTIYGTLASTYSQHVLYVAGMADVDIVLNGLGFCGLSGVYPYTTCVFALGNHVAVLNAGTYASPLEIRSGTYFATVNQARSPYLTLQRCYVTGGTLIYDWRTTNNVTIVSCGGDYTDTSKPVSTNGDWRGVKCAGTLGSSDGRLAGTHFWDAFTSVTAGRVVLLMHPPSVASTSRVTFTPSATAYFNGSNGLLLQAVNDTCTWEDCVYRIGHTGFDGAPVMAGGTASNYLIEFQIDKNNGAGWSDWAEATEANLEGHNATIDAALGFKMKVRITCDTANTSAFTSVYFGTTSTTTTQAYQYKIYETPVTVKCIDANTLTPIAGCVVYVDAGTGGEYTLGAEIGNGITNASGECVIVLKHDATQQVNGVARKSSSTPYYRQGVLQATIAPGVSQTLTIAMTRED